MVLALSALMLASACGDDSGSGEGPDDFESVELGKLVVTPDNVVFTTAELGIASTEYITLSNPTGTPIKFTLNLIEDPTPRDRQREFAWEVPDNAKGDITLGGGETLSLGIVYTAADLEQDTGRIEIRAAGGGDPRNVTLTGPTLAPDIDASPARVSFGRIPAGQSGSKILTIQNAGQAPLNVTRVVFGDSADEFTMCFPSLGQSCDNRDACTNVLEEATVLNPFDELKVDVCYNPVDPGADNTEILVESNDPDEPTLRVPVEANGSEPCIEVSEEAIDFGASFIGGVSSRTVTITNCSNTKNLAVNSIALGAASAPEFFIDGLPDVPLELASEQTTSFVINYAPTAEAAHEGTIEIRSSDEARSPLIVPVNGRGSNNACPVPVANARISGVGGPATNQVETAPLATIIFDGSESYDPDNPNDPISSYEWVIVEAPTDSTAQFAPNNRVANPQLFIDLAGRYRVELRVYDSFNTPSCTVGEVTILATPDEDIHVQLVWETPGDPNELDTGIGRGSDVDLHFLHPRGTYNLAPYDCYWQNIEPDWGGSGRSDDPSLDIDDTDGAGPENINLNNPEDVSYRVGVYYFDDHNYGPAYATVRIYVRQVLVFEYRDKYLENSGKFWDVASVAWPSGSVSQIDSNPTDGFP